MQTFPRILMGALRISLVSLLICETALLSQTTPSTSATSAAPHEQNHSCSDRDELEAQRFGLFAETLFISLSLFFTFLKEHAFIVGLAGG